MRSLHLKPTEFTPEFKFEIEDSQLLVKGNSEGDQSETFYSSLTEFVNVIEEGKPLRLKCSFDYSNLCRSSKRGLLFFLIRLKDLQRNCNTQLLIDWKYDESNDLVRSIGENLEYMVRLKMNFIPQSGQAKEEEKIVELAY